MSSDIQTFASHPAVLIDEAGVQVIGERVVSLGRIYLARSIGGVEVTKGSGDLRDDFNRIARSLGYLLFGYFVFGTWGAIGSLIGAAFLEFGSVIGSGKLSLKIIVQGQRVELARVSDVAQGIRIANAILQAVDEAR